MKKLTVILCALALAAGSLCACGNDNKKEDASAASQASAQVTEAASDSVAGTWTLDSAKLEERVISQQSSLPEGASMSVTSNGTLHLNADSTFTMEFTATIKGTMEGAGTTEKTAHVTADGNYTTDGKAVALNMKHATSEIENQVSEMTEETTVNATVNGNELTFDNYEVPLVFTR